MTSLKSIGRDGQFYKGIFGSMSEGCIVAKQDADSRFHFGLEMLVSLEGEFTVQPDTQNMWTTTNT